jgi:multimeric flavodoxin WrbA
MNTFYPKLLESEVIVFAAPIYWFTYSAQLKLFIDRLYALHGSEGYALINKKLAFLLVYGDSSVEGSGVNNAIGSLDHLSKYMKSDVIGFVHGTAYRIGDAEKNNQLIAEVKDLGQKIVNSL